MPTDHEHWPVSGVEPEHVHGPAAITVPRQSGKTTLVLSIADVCRAAAARRLEPCSIRAGDLLGNTCACGHVGYVHGRTGMSKSVGCTVCPPEDPPDVG